MFDYNSPIEIIMNDIQPKIENQIVKAVQNVGITVDKKELLKALNYDREEYEKGYADAKSEIVHCKDCIAYDSKTDRFEMNVCKRNNKIFPKNGYCSFGIKKDCGAKMDEKSKSDNVIEKVYCKDCQFLEIESGGYACCGKAIKGIVKPWDFCKKGIKKANE